MINRGNGRAAVFHESPDYEAFLALLSEARIRRRVSVAFLTPRGEEVGTL
jgi:hypothetical protein